MNLTTDPWIHCTRQNGMRDRIAPWQIVETDNPVTDVQAPRHDFRGALIQFLIGLIQTACPPENGREWAKWWRKAPSPDYLRERFLEVAAAFEFDSDGPAFMQDFDLPEGEFKPITSLLIEAPGGKTLRDNLDHFVKRGTVNAVCPCCAASVLFTLQTNAPSGGVGHRVGLRGGGPLTTLVLPDETVEEPALWQKLLPNIIPKEEFEKLFPDCKIKSEPADIFPWLAPTRTSESKTGRETFPEDAHPCQMYWGMPRRIRLDFSDTRKGECDLCGESSERLLMRYRTKNYGVNYTGPWEHPLSPHYIDPKKPPIPAHGQKGGVGYRHWLGLVLDDDKKNQKSALVVSRYLTKRLDDLDADPQVRLWVFGYDMDNMKARCWYDSVMPIYPVRNDRQRKAVKDTVSDFIRTAEEIAGSLRKEVKNAWFKRPSDIKGSMAFIDREFWNRTEIPFFASLKEIVPRPDDTGEVRKQWHGELKRSALDIFDRWAVAGPPENLNMRRVVKARNDLQKWMNGKKIKQLIGGQVVAEK